MPKAKDGPLTDHDTEVQVSEVPRSQSFVTFEFPAFHKYTLDASPTAK